MILGWKNKVCHENNKQIVFSCKHTIKKDARPVPWGPPKVVPVSLVCQLIIWIDCILKPSMLRSAMIGTNVITYYFRNTNNYFFCAVI